jgi:hypothetical protein
MSYRTILGAMAVALMALVPAESRAQDYISRRDRLPDAGVYRLTELDGVPVPAVVDIDDEGRCRQELYSAALTLRRNGTWGLVSRNRDVCYGDLVRDFDDDFDEGTYVLTGSTILFFDEDGRIPADRDLDVYRDDVEIDDLEVGTLSPNALSVRLDDGVIATFRKR